MCALAAGQAIFECEITHLYRYVFDESRDQILGKRIFYVHVPDGIYRLLSLHPNGKALAVGKYADTANLLDVNLPVRFRAGVTPDQPLGATMGGTGVTSLSALKDQLGVGEPCQARHGLYSFNCAGPSSNVTFTINYGYTFAQPPVVQCTLQLSTGYNYITYAIGNVSQTYFQFLISNTNATARACVMHWMAAPV